MQLKIPQHVAIIMDGNSRWAKKKLLPKKLGYRKGLDAAEKAVEIAQKYDVKVLTLYILSSENLERDELEINYLMDLFRKYLKNNILKLKNRGIKILFIGNRERLPSDIRELMLEAEAESADNSAFTLILAVSYGARDEIRRAALSMVNYAINNKRDVDKLTPTDFDRFINLPGIPDPDLLIRTSGEYRVSNFLLWQLAYTELYFTETLWPDFSEKDFISAIKSFGSRERRYGK